MKTFNQFINEGVRDLMKPKSEEDIKKSLDKLTPEYKLHKIYSHKVQHLYTDEEIKKLLNELSLKDKINNIYFYKIQHLYTKEEIVSDIVETILNNYRKNTTTFNLINYRPVINYDFAINIMDNLKSHYGNNIYLQIDKEYKLEFKEFCWDKNIAFSEITETEYKIMSTDKIKQLLTKLVKDVFNEKTFTFSIRRLN